MGCHFLLLAEARAVRGETNSPEFTNQGAALRPKVSQ